MRIAAILILVMLPTATMASTVSDIAGTSKQVSTKVEALEMHRGAWARETPSFRHIAFMATEKPVPPTKTGAQNWEKTPAFGHKPGVISFKSDDKIARSFSWSVASNANASADTKQIAKVPVPPAVVAYFAAFAMMFGLRAKKDYTRKPQAYHR